MPPFSYSRGQINKYQFVFQPDKIIVMEWNQVHNSAFSPEKKSGLQGHVSAEHVRLDESITHLK